MNGRFYVQIDVQVNIRPSFQDASMQCDFSEVMTSTSFKRFAEPPNMDSSFTTEDSSYSEGDPSSPSYQSSQPSQSEIENEVDKPCYLVFESALMLLFMTCKYCGSSVNNITKTTIGSLLQVSILCTNCLKGWVWKSQPFMRNIPAGNILTSSAILYSGSLPAKALWLFKILNCPTITYKTFFDHQKFYLQPAINLIWSFQRTTVLDQLKHMKNELALGGD